MEIFSYIRGIMCNFDESGTSCPLYPQCEAFLDSCSSTTTGANSNFWAQKRLILVRSSRKQQRRTGVSFQSRAIYSRLVFQVGLWDQVLGMEQMGPICVSALSSGGRLWKSMFLFCGASFFSESFSLLDVLASVIGLGKRELGALFCAVLLC